jgi:1,4-dihydroxy-2-naphthoate octaprenyltransferase
MLYPAEPNEARANGLLFLVHREKVLAYASWIGCWLLCTCKTSLSLNMIQPWLQAARLRTLPLAMASVGMGAVVAIGQGAFRVEVLIWSILTTICLQVLSNFANDYGDSVHGADHADRIGPQRMVASGQLSPKAMRIGMWVMGVCSLVCGIALLLVSMGSVMKVSFLVMLLLGLLAIAAAITYTAGRKPYGYAGLGDVSVLIFFGWVGVGGSYFLHSGIWSPSVLFPATAVGLMATGVLNLNNIRDMAGDTKAGKRTVASRLGWPLAGHYHSILLGLAVFFLLLYLRTAGFAGGMRIGLLFPVVMALLLHGRKVYKLGAQRSLDPQLRLLALITLSTVVWLSVWIAVKAQG